MFDKLKDKLTHHSSDSTEGPHQSGPLGGQRGGHGGPVGGQQQVPMGGHNNRSASFSPLQTGVELSRHTFQTFYHPHEQHFCATCNEQGTVTDKHGYVVWPIGIEFWAIADSAKRSGSKEDLHELDLTYQALEKHWNPNFKGYTAWKWHKGNQDLYFDDNAHCGNALVTAFEATNNRTFLQKAAELTNNLLVRGWDRQGKPGGMAWHINKPDTRNSCSTFSTAMLAARLALHGVETEHLGKMAHSNIQFGEKHLFGQDGVVIDKIQRGPNGQWTQDERRFTYNTGFAISAFVHFFQLSGDQSYLEKAKRLATTSINPECALFDDAIPNPNQRIWKDNTFFSHHLVDGLVLLATALGPQDQLSQQITQYLTRFAAFVRTYVFDEEDSLCFRNLRPYFINARRTQRFNRDFGTNKNCNPQAGERENGEGGIGQRRLIKTLLGNAGAARIFLCISDLVKEVPLMGGTGDGGGRQAGGRDEL